MVVINFYVDRDTVVGGNIPEGRKMMEFQRILLRTTKTWRTSSSTTFGVFFLLITMVVVVCVVECVLKEFEEFKV